MEINIEEGEEIYDRNSVAARTGVTLENNVGALVNCQAIILVLDGTF